MPTPIEQALASLLPTLSPLPHELLDLSTSLLAQSRARASTLKPEEEIGRTYACCHIACERLGKKLALEIVGRPTPPVQPRVYAKLKGFLGSMLRTPGTPKGKGRGRGVEEKAVQAASSAEGARSSARVMPSKGVVGIVTAGRRVEDGVLRPQSGAPGSEGREMRSSALQTPTRDVVTTQLAGSKRKAEAEAEEEQVDTDVGTSATMAPGDEAQEDADEASEYEGQAVTPAKRPAKTPLRRNEKHLKQKDGEAAGAAGLLPGLGTMFQPAIDWLSEERRLEYAVWKKRFVHDMEVLCERQQEV